MKKSNGRIRKLIGLLVIFFIVINFIPTNYFIMAPGIAQELSPMITVEDGYKTKSKGAFMLTAVASQRATIWDYIYFMLKKPRGVELEPVEEQLPPGMDMQEYLEIMEKFMKDSQLKAQAVAFKKAGFNVEIQGEGAVIDEVLENGSAAGKLKKGDVIIAVDDQVVKVDQDAVDLIRKHEIGDRVKITIKRGDKMLDFTLETIEMENNPGKASIGLMIFTDYSYQFPRKVTFNTQNIAGPSAGSMFTLEIYNQLLPEDLTKGRRIAGTGTIALDGSIGKIDGVRQKVIAAEREEADIFFVPVENYETAKKVAREITLVPVKNIDEAITYLEKTEQNQYVIKGVVKS
ncbi:MAG: Lon-like protease [Halanaerobiales bacterium]|nr:Lon-like protease [Halanaerobiales bacterium]